MGMATRFVGKSLPRTEDARLLRGLGRYTADIAPGEACHMFVIRSPHAAAMIGGMDLAAAKACPGVRLVIGPEDAEVAELGSFTSRVRRNAPDGRPNFVPEYRALSTGRARFLGDVVGAIVADTMAQAKDAAEALATEWERLPSVTETRVAADVGVPPVWDEVPNNVCFLFDAGKPAEVEAALATAPLKVTFTYPVNRVIAAPMETRTALAAYDPAGESYTLWAGLQNPHFIREELARVLGIDGNRLRVVAPDTGGAFGLKESPFPEHVLALVAARRIGRPVLWVSERSESFIADHHARDHYSTVTLGLDRDGTFLALRIETLSNLGAYLSFNGVHTATNNLGGLSGLYRTPLIHARVRGVFTNTPPTSPYRGAGRPEATYAIERAIDLAARRYGFDRVDLRRRNMIAPSQMPWQTGFVFTYDSGEFERNMDDALRLMDWEGFPTRRQEARARGKFAGIGVANAIEIANGPITGPFTESAEIRFDATGSATVLLGVHSQGQGHEITFAQIAADLLGLEVGEVRVRYGDTDQIEHGTGSFGSRSVVAAGTALTRVAEQIVARGRMITASHFEADETDVEFDGRAFSVAGTDRKLTTREVARLSYQLPPDRIGGTLGLAAKRIAAPSAPTFPNGCHVCEVEIDPDTGDCDIVGYCVVDDVGRVINPRLVKGQIQGGVVQGIGQILMEDIRYDEDGQLLSGSFMDYAMPRASDLPSIICKSNEVLTSTNPVGAKGAGEAGTVGALAAVISAISDALAPLGIEHVDMPATPERIWRTIQRAKSQV